MERNKCEEVRDDDEDAGILYEIMVYAEWQQEPELYGRGFSHVDEMHSKKGLSSSQGSSALWWPLYFRSRCSIPSDIERLTSGQLNWNFAVGGDGKVVAILQDQLLEIRSHKDEYASVIGKSSVGKDPFPQWRRLAWSSDCSMLAVSYSNGSADFFDALGFKLFLIRMYSSVTSDDLSNALASILFVETRVANTRWSFEVLLINYKGVLRSYFVSPTDGFEAGHTFDFSIGCHPNGLTAVVFHPGFGILICGGSADRCREGDGQSNTSARQHGITAWRVLNGFPHYRLSLSLEEEEHTKRSSTALFGRLPGILYRNVTDDTIFKLSLSPNGTLLAAIHTSGTVSIWEVPSLRHRTIVRVEHQPNFDAMDPSFADYRNDGKRNLLAKDPLKYRLSDICFWSEKAVILGRCSGAVTVSSIRGLDNLLGSSAEWFEGYPRLSTAYDGGFLIMECDWRLSTKRRATSPTSDDGDESESEDSDEDEGKTSFVHVAMKITKTILYFMTDNERFQPRRRKPRFLTRMYRLNCLKATTPESLFSRKLDDEEYGEALSLAQLYNLDCDVVYQRQWRNSPVSVASIQDYLSKIKKRSWVLHECLDRVPEDLTATRALLEYGLQGTDLEALISIGKGTDEGKYMLCNSERVLIEESLDAFDPDELERKRDREKELRDSLVLRVDFANFSLEQKQLCLTRQKLLRIIRRLNTYEVMLGGSSVASEHFDHKFFHRFREQPAVEAAIQFAHEGNWQYVAAMFTYHGSETLPHRLAILTNFSEAISPVEYCSLLPEAGYESTDPEVFPWDQENDGDIDWVEFDLCSQALGQVLLDSADFLYENDTELEKFRGLDLSGEHLTQWYTKRANDIEKESRFVDNALELVKLGMERNVQALGKLHDDLLTLEVLVYDCFVDESITLEHLQAMDDIDKLRFLMSRSSEEHFVKNVRRWLLPFVSRCDRHSVGSGRKLMRDYFMSLAKHDLTLCTKVFDKSRVEQSDPIVSPVKELISLALDCIYNCKEDDQLANACTILECLPVRGYGSETESLHDELDLLERHLAAAEILQKHDVSKPIVFIRDCQTDKEQVKQLFTLLTRVASRKDVEVREAHWRELLEDVLELQADVFQCVDVKSCLEIFVQSMLCSGNKENIQLAGELLEGAKSPLDGRGGVFKGIMPFPHGIPKESAISLVVSASKEYFNSASDVDDPSMELARYCLRLINEADSEIQAELDLIDALPILREFGMNILPLQARLCDNRLLLIEQVFLTKRTAYKNAQKVMKLAQLLRVGQDVKLWEGDVHILIASAAFEARDYSSCCKACNYLVLQMYGRGWRICLDLGQCDTFKDVQARHDLLTFAAIHCDSEYLEGIICTQRRFQIRMLQSQLQTEIESRKLPSVPDDNRPRFNTTELAKQLQNLPGETTKHLLNAVGSVEFWKISVSWMRPLWQGDNSSHVCDEWNTNADFEKMSIPAFYSTLTPDCIESPLSPRYVGYDMPIGVDPSLSLGLLILRLALLQEHENDEESVQISPFVVQEVARNLLPHDSLLGLAHLLTLNDPSLIDDCFIKFPNTGACLQLAMLCFSLKICRLAKLVPLEKLYSSDPKDVVKRALQYATSRKKGDEMLAKCSTLVLSYKRKLADFLQGRVLLGLGRGVDVVRFSQDDEYKRETVLGLAMSTEDKVYKTAVSLAHRYGISLADLYMVHLCYLFGDSEVDTHGLQHRISSLGLLTVLLKDVEKFRDKLENVVLVTISGTDHSRFLYYLKLLGECLPKDKQIQSSVGLLRKLQSFAPGLDFKKLLFEPQNLLDVLTPILSGANIQAVVKTLPQISKVCGKTASESEIYRTWLEKVFYHGDDELKKVPRLHQEWVSRYNSCKEHFKQLEASDLVRFIDSTLFIERALDDIPQTTRKQLLSYTLKYAKRNHGKFDGETLQRHQWQEAVDQLDRSLRHVEWMRNDLVEKLRNSSDAGVRHFLRRFEVSKPERVGDILLQCAIAGKPIETLQELISICPPNVCTSLEEVTSQTLSLVQNALRHRDNDANHNLLADKNPIDVLQGILTAVLNHVTEGGDLVNVEDTVEQLRPLCEDKSVPVDTRLSVLKMLEQVCPSDSQLFKTLSTYKTEAIVASTWPDVEILPEDIAMDEARESLFTRLLLKCESLNHLDTLSKLLISWPPTNSRAASDCAKNCLCKIMMAMLGVSDDVDRFDSVINVLRQTRLTRELHIQCLLPVMDRLSKEGPFLHRVKFGLLTGHEGFHTAVLNEAAQQNPEDIEKLDEEVYSLLVERRLVARTVPSVLYQPLARHLLAEMTYEEVEGIARDLKEAGYHPEAASLLVSSAGIPEGLRTFNTGIGLLKRLLS